MYYVYELRFPNGTPFYVGKSSTNRVNEIILNLHHPELRRQIWDIHSKDKSPQFAFVFESPIESKAFKKKASLIAKHGRKDLGIGPLLNENNGTAAKKEPKKAMSLKFDKSVHTRIKKFCAQFDITITEFILTCVLRFLDQFEFYYDKEHR